MGAVTDLIDKTEELLGHSPHPMIVTVPLGAWVVSNICDVCGLASSNRSFDDTARQSMGIGLLGAAGAVVTGLRDYSSIPKERPSHAIATKHAIGNAVVGSLFTASFILRKLDHQAGRRPSLLSRMLGLAGGTLGLYTSWLGGVLVEEHGEGVKPVMQQLEKQEEQHGNGRKRSPRKRAGARKQ